MHTSNYSLEVLINGRPVQEYYKDGKSFIESRFGTEYTLRFRNNSWKRVMAIISVDGIEVIKGKAASEADNGYIVDAFSSIDVKGYRIDDKNVAAFKFSDLVQGYNIVVGAAKVDQKTGEVTHEKTSKNSGVIGVRVVEEDTADHDYAGRYKKIPQTDSSSWGILRGVSGALAVSGGSIRTSYPAYGVSVGSVATGCLISMARTTVNQMGQLSAVPRSISDLTSCYVNQGCLDSDIQDTVTSFSAVAPDFDTSTQWGAKLEDRVKEVSFKRSTKTVDIEIYYASRPSLEQFGIDFSRTKQIFAWPSAFEDKKQYCKVPPGYKL